MDRGTGSPADRSISLAQRLSLAILTPWYEVPEVECRQYRCPYAPLPSSTIPGTLSSERTGIPRRSAAARTERTSGWLARKLRM